MSVKTEYKYIHRIELCGILELKSPLHIGSGNSNNSDLDILLDVEDNPYIPATSIAGVIRQYLMIHDVPATESYFGTARNIDNTGEQSRIIFYDSSLLSQKKKTIKIRDGIRIDPKTGIVEDKAKYDYEILDPGIQFDFKILLKYSDDDKDKAKQFMKTIETLLANESIQFGANANNGFGKVKLVQSEYKIYEIDNTIDSVWNRILKKPITTNTAKPLVIQTNEFSIKLLASIQNSLIIGDTDPDSESDKTQLKSDGKSVVTGSSLKGVIRSRIERILNTLYKADSDEYYKLKYTLLGFTKEEFKQDNGKLDEDKWIKVTHLCNPKQKEASFKYDSLKGKLRVEEFPLKDVHAEMQTRIKIDRFTGGTIESALFDSMPVFSGANKENVEIDFLLDKHNFPEWEKAAGLLLLVLKDIWTGTLAIGGEKNVGRGRLKGIKAEIKWNDTTQNHKIVFTDNAGKPKSENPEDWKMLNQFVTKLNQSTGAK